ncbi:hypothetical protein ACFQJ7_09915 [Halovenus rubra]|uniref:Uncharacterized protein n=2 Tax=Halovenus rubra TaxID=869890 RepID=A0ACC7DXA8_9EURY|nr:hypothetical protein [Halovenus rubra]
MTGFAVYSTTADPDRLYATGDTDAIDAATTAEMVWTGDRPLDMVVDLADRRLWWTFEADRDTKTTRTGHFVAAYDGSEDLFAGFAEELRALHESDEWAVPSIGDSQHDAGFELWRVPPTVESVDTPSFDGLVEKLTDGDKQRGSPVTVEMDEFHDALRVLRALDDAGIDCTVGIDSGDDVFHFQHIDTLLVPTGGMNFTFRGEQPAVEDSPEVGGDATTESLSAKATNGQQSHGSDFSAGGMTARLAGVILVGLLGFATYSFFTRQPVQPISGLATFGAFVGTFGAVNLWFMLSADAGNKPVTARRRAGELLWRPFQAYGVRAILVLTLGTFAGFILPRIFWEVGMLAGRDGFLFGPLSTLTGSVPTVAVYVACLFAGTVTALWFGSRTGRWQPLRGETLRPIAAGFAVYGVCLVLMTGLANALWYGFVPAI